MFKVGSYVVYPAHGAGVIESVENKEIAGTTKTYYVIKIIESGITVMVPTESAESIGMRDIISGDLIPRVFEILKVKKAKTENGAWNKRYKEFMEKIKTGSTFEIAEVMRDLLLLKQQKTLSFRENRMLEFARGILVKEISLATNTEENKVEKKIRELFSH